MTSIGNDAFAKCDILEIISRIENPFVINTQTFSDNTFYNATLYVPEGTIEKYKATDGWNKFTFIEEENGGGDTPEPPTPQKCADPTIAFENGKIVFDCETEGAEFISTIAMKDTQANKTKEVELSGTYIITVYAKKEGYENSETVTQEVKVGGVVGDVNGDGVVDISDYIGVANIILTGKP